MLTTCPTLVTWWSKCFTWFEWCHDNDFRQTWIQMVDIWHQTQMIHLNIVPFPSRHSLQDLQGSWILQLIKCSNELSILKVTSICEFNGHFVWISLFQKAANPLISTSSCVCRGQTLFITLLSTFCSQFLGWKLVETPNNKWWSQKLLFWWDGWVYLEVREVIEGSCFWKIVG